MPAVAMMISLGRTRTGLRVEGHGREVGRAGAGGQQEGRLRRHDDRRAHDDERKRERERAGRAARERDQESGEHEADRAFDGQQERLADPAADLRDDDERDRREREHQQDLALVRGPEVRDRDDR